jgi:zinc protease
MQKLATELFGDWKSPVSYERITNTYTRVEPINRKIETPDKQNALFLASMPTRITDEDPDAPALVIAGTIIGGTPNSRLFQRIRVKDGLSYGANGGFSVPTRDVGGRFSANAIAAPQNMPKVKADFNEEITKALKDGFTAEEVEKAKTAWLDEQKVARTEESMPSYTTPLI